MTDLKMPRFESEAEEAQWWYDNREAVSQEILKAAREGRLGEGTAARQARRIKEANERVSAA